jgi:hypothetical protein
LNKAALQITLHFQRFLNGFLNGFLYDGEKLEKFWEMETNFNFQAEYGGEEIPFCFGAWILGLG